MLELRYFPADARQYICNRVPHGRRRFIGNRLHRAAKRFEGGPALTGRREFDPGHARPAIFILHLRHKGKEKRERAALAGAALHADLTAEQMRKLGTDRQTQPRAAETPARGAVGLAERFENDLLLVRRNADARIDDRERHDFLRRVEHGMSGHPAGCHHGDFERHAAPGRELERVG